MSPDHLSEIEERLEAAQDRLRLASAALAPKHKGGEMEAFRDAIDQMYKVERELAAAKGEQYAAPLDFPVLWDVGAPLPHVFASDGCTLLTFYVAEANPAWDGSYVSVKDPRDQSVELLALVEFNGCVSTRFGDPNDEVFDGHPLHGRGLEGYTAQVVVNSIWLEELEAINSVHSQYDPGLWRELRHFVFWFHDNTFECVAKSFEVEVHRESMAAMIERVTRRLL